MTTLEELRTDRAARARLHAPGRCGASRDFRPADGSAVTMEMKRRRANKCRRLRSARPVANGVDAADARSKGPGEFINNNNYPTPPGTPPRPAAARRPPSSRSRSAACRRPRGGRQSGGRRRVHVDDLSSFAAAALPPPRFPRLVATSSRAWPAPHLRARRRRGAPPAVLWKNPRAGTPTGPENVREDLSRRR